MFGMDFMSSRRVMAMNTPERGAYLQLLFWAWDDPWCSLPTSENELKQLAGWTTESWGSFKRIRACFTKHPTQAGRLHNARLYEEWRYTEEKSEAAKASAKARWQKPAEQATPKNPILKNLNDRSGSGFESVGAIADKHFKPT